MDKIQKDESAVKSIKELISEVVHFDKRQHINIMPGHVTTLHGTKGPSKKKRRKKCINTLSREKYAELGLYQLPKTKLKFDDVYPLHTLWKGYIKEYFSGLDNRQIPKITDTSYDSFSKSLVKVDLHGAIIEVIKSTCPNFVRANGIVVVDTKNTLKIINKENKLLTIPKRDCIFSIKYGSLVFTIFGKHFTIRPAERSVKKIKSAVTSIL